MFLNFILIWIFLNFFQKFKNTVSLDYFYFIYNFFEKYIYIYIKKTTPFSFFGLAISFQKCPQFSIQITHVTNR